MAKPYGLAIRFSQSETVLYSNTSKYRKIWKTKLRTFLRMVGEYNRPWIMCAEKKAKRLMCSNKFFLTKKTLQILYKSNGNKKQA